MMNDREVDRCFKNHLRPWLAGLGILVAIGIGYVLVDGGIGDGLKVTQGYPQNTGANLIDSYHQIVETIRPAVVGISLPGARPFLQGAKPQVWQYSRAQSNTLTDEYLQCPNCLLRLKLQVGMPRSNATCPTCKATMAYVIRELASVPNQANSPLGQQQAANQLPSPAFGQKPLGGLGSGVIVSNKGYILTNYHLISGQANIKVTLFSSQGERSFAGTVVATAPENDLAIVKIEAGGLNKFPVAPIGDSAQIAIGEQVLAFGNPFGLAQSVTSGVVSAIRKNIVIEGHRLSELIQTDAPINQGNSGGPLVNLKGEVIGINTAIYSPAQTHTGLGFAVPINKAKESFSQFMDLTEQQVGFKSVSERGYGKGYPMASTGASAVWLGIEVQPFNEIFAEQMNVPVKTGLIINRVWANSPAAESGLQAGDVIYRVNDQRITNEAELRSIITGKRAGEIIGLTIFRRDQKLVIKVKLSNGLSQPMGMTNNQPVNLLEGSEIEAGTADIASIGVTVDAITPEVAFAFNLPLDSKGVVIAEVEGLAMQAGIKEGDLVTGVDGMPIFDLVSFFRALRKGNLARGLKLEISRGGKPLQIEIRELASKLPRGL